MKIKSRTLLGIFLMLIAADVAVSNAYGRGGAPGGHGGGGAPAGGHGGGGGGAPAGGHGGGGAPAGGGGGGFRAPAGAMPRGGGAVAAPHVSGGNVPRMSGGNQAVPRAQSVAPRSIAPPSSFVNRTPSFSRPATMPNRQIGVQGTHPNLNTANNPSFRNNIQGQNRPGIQLGGNPNQGAVNRANLNPSRPGINTNQTANNGNRPGFNPNQSINNANRQGFNGSRTSLNPNRPENIRNAQINGRNNTFNRMNLVNNNNRIGITNRNLGGNQIRIGNQAVNIANTNYRPAFYNHSGYHGYWNGNWYGNRGWNGGWGGSGWGYGNGLAYGGYGGYGAYGPGWGYWGRPLGWGLGAWGLGSLLYNSGYLGYSNPYYLSGYSGVGYNYAQPIPVVYDATDPSLTVVDNSVPVDPSSANVVSTNSDAMLNEATVAFKQGNYDAALDIANKAISQYPNDSVLHEFRALTLFAKQDYQQAAATLHSILAVGPGWDWTTMSSFYGDTQIYTDQLRSLEGFVKGHPQDAGSRFVLAYHYLSTAYPDAAARQLQQVTQLMPNDQVAADLSRMLSKPDTQQASAESLAQVANKPVTSNPDQPVPVPPSTESGKTVDTKQLIGTWHASRDDGSKFEIALKDDSKFTWKYSPAKGNSNEFSGHYSITGDVLSLEQESGGALVGQVNPDKDGEFHFKAIGAPPEDPGLDFRK